MSIDLLLEQELELFKHFFVPGGTDEEEDVHGGFNQHDFSKDKDQHSGSTDYLHDAVPRDRKARPQSSESRFGGKNGSKQGYSKIHKASCKEDSMV